MRGGRSGRDVPQRDRTGREGHEVFGIMIPWVGIMFACKSIFSFFLFYLFRSYGQEHEQRIDCLLKSSAK